jgi:hypothetical protein
MMVRAGDLLTCVAFTVEILIRTPDPPSYVPVNGRDATLSDARVPPYAMVVGDASAFMPGTAR